MMFSGVMPLLALVLVWPEVEVSAFCPGCGFVQPKIDLGRHPIAQNRTKRFIGETIDAASETLNNIINHLAQGLHAENEFHLEVSVV